MSTKKLKISTFPLRRKMQKKKKKKNENETKNEIYDFVKTASEFNKVMRQPKNKKETIIMNIMIIMIITIITTI